MLAEEFANRAVTVGWRVAVPGCCVTAGPVSRDLRTQLDGHADAVALIVAAAAHLREIPPRAEISRPPFGVRLKAPTSKHHRLARHLDFSAVTAHTDTTNAGFVPRNRHCCGLVEDANARALRRTVFGIGQADTATNGFHHQPTEPFDLVTDFGGLPAIRQKPNSIGVQPFAAAKLSHTRISLKTGSVRY